MNTTNIMSTKPKILLVDDKPENLVALRKVLRDLDVDLCETSSGNEALKATLHTDFALALLDIQMPEMDGYELAGILREEEKTSQLPFIFISAVYTDNLNVFKGYEKGAFSFITKPFQPEILINKVQFFIDKYRQEAALIELNNKLKDKNIELEQMNKELESFSYSVSHDLRAPIRAVDGYSKILEEEYNKVFDDEGRRLLGTIQYNAGKMSMLIDDLLAFSRLGRKPVQKTNLNMDNLIEGVLMDFNKTTKHNGEIKIGNLHPIRGDYGLLNQVFVNLVSNGVKYSSKKTKSVVEITSEVLNNEVIYRIKDNGVGFDMKYSDKLFGVFQRLHTPEEFEGTGIGLAIVQRIITKHGGRVWAQSKLNEGATFSFSLPIEG